MPLVRKQQADGSYKQIAMSDKQYQNYRRERAEEKARLQDVDPLRETAARRRTSASEQDVREPIRKSRASHIRDDIDDRPAPRAEDSKRRSSKTESRGSKESSRSSKGKEVSRSSKGKESSRSHASVETRGTREETTFDRAPAPTTSQPYDSQPSAAQRARIASSGNTVHVSTTETSSGQTRKLYQLPADTKVSYSDYGGYTAKPAYTKRPEHLYVPEPRSTSTSNKGKSTPSATYLTPAELKRRRELDGTIKPQKASAARQSSAADTSAPAIPEPVNDTSNDEYLARLNQEEWNLTEEPQAIEGYDPQLFGPDVPKPSSRAAEKAPARESKQSLYDQMLAQQLQDQENGVRDAVVEVIEEDDFPTFNSSQFEQDPNGASSSKTTSYSYKVAGGNDFPDYDPHEFEKASNRNAKVASSSKQSKVARNLATATSSGIALVNNMKDKKADDARGELMARLTTAGAADRDESSRRFDKFESSMGGASSDHLKNVYDQVVKPVSYKLMTAKGPYTTVSKVIEDELAYYRDRRDHSEEIKHGLWRVIDSEWKNETFHPFGKTPPDMMIDILSFSNAKCHDGEKRYNLMDSFFSALQKIGTKDYEHRSDGSVYEAHCGYGQVKVFVEGLQGYAAPTEVDDKQLAKEMIPMFKDFVSRNSDKINQEIERSDSESVSEKYRLLFVAKLKKEIVDIQGSIVPQSQFMRVVASDNVWPKGFDLEYSGLI